MNYHRRKGIASIPITMFLIALMPFAFFYASGSITLNPTVFAINAPTSTLANGGIFGSGATVTFYLSPSTSFSNSSTSIGTYTLPAGTTTLSNANVSLTIPSGTAPGLYFVAASDDGGKTFTSPVAVMVSSLSPSITLSPSTAKAGSTVTLTGSGFDSGSTITVYLNYASGPVLLSSVSQAALSSGVSLTVPTNEPGGTYAVVAQESSSSSTNYGITADASLTITPSVAVSPSSISGATTSTFTLTGYGFPADDSFAASTSLNPANTITVNSIDALNPAFTSSSTGSFTVTVTGLASVITAGPASISIRDSSGHSFPNVGSILVSVPNPTALGFTFSITPTYGSTYNVYDPVAITVFNFPAFQNVQFYLGSTLVGSLTTDSNGAGTLSTVVPQLPGGTYTPIAFVPSLYLVAAGATSYTISPSFEVLDPAGAPLNVASASTGEYIPSDGVITVKAFGLNPTLNAYDFYDSIAAPSSGHKGVYASGLVTSILIGYGTSSLMRPAPNGTLIFTYSPGYPSTTATGTEGSITSANGVPAYGSATASYQYYAIGAVTFTSPSNLQIYAAGSTGNLLSVSGLIPSTAALYPGVTNNYNAYIGSNELTLTFTNPSGVVVTGTVFNTADSAIKFAVPSVSGVYSFSITYNGQPVSSAVGVQTIVVSSSGSSPSAGTLVLLPTGTGWDVVGFGYEQGVAVNFYYMTINGVKGPYPESLSNGAFVDTSALAIAPSEPAGTYAVFTEVTSSGVNYFVYSSYTITASLTLTPSNGTIGTPVGVITSGLVPTSYYNLYFGTMLVSSGTPSSLNFTVPAVQPGTYNVTITPVGSTSVIASASFTVQASSEIILITD